MSIIHTKKVLVEVPSLLWAEVQDRAKAEGRFVRAVVTDALEGYLRGDRPRPTPQTDRLRTGEVAEQLRARGLPALKTAKQLMMDQEARRGDEGGDQRRDDDDGPF